MKGFTYSIYKTSNWIMKLAYVNILWIAFTLAGLVIFGFFPSTVAMFAVVRKWISYDKENFSAFNVFSKTYKQEFLKSNLLGLIIMIIFFLFSLEMNFIQEYNNQILDVFFYPMLILFCFIVLTVLFIFPTYVHYEVGIFHLIKNSFLMMILNPIPTILMIACCIGSFFISLIFPVSLVFFGGSLLAFITTKSASMAFQKIEQTKNY
jgi:uncharacterized membrane protein YesL